MSRWGRASRFVPDTLNIHVGNTVEWPMASSGHSVSSGDLCTIDKQFCLPDNTNWQAGTLSNAGTVYEHTSSQSGTFLTFVRRTLDRHDWRDQCCALELGAYSTTGRSAHGVIWRPKGMNRERPSICT